MSHYETLGVAANATPEEIKQAFRKQAKQHHPDLGGDAAKFQSINEAYETLSDPQKKHQFDNPNPFGNMNFHNQGGTPFGFQFHQQSFNINDMEISAIQVNQAQTLLKQAYNQSKRIEIQDPDKSLVIEYNTPERDFFLSQIEKLSTESKFNNITLSYYQKVNDEQWSFSALPSIWSYIFKDLFTCPRPNNPNIREYVRQVNKEIYERTDAIMQNKLSNRATVEDFETITYEFKNPNGIIINVNDKATQLLNDPSVDDYTKGVITALKNPQGLIYLIQKKTLL